MAEPGDRGKQKGRGDEVLLTFLVSPALRDRIKECANVEDKSMSQYIRDAIKEYMKKTKNFPHY